MPSLKSLVIGEDAFFNCVRAVFERHSFSCG